MFDKTTAERLIGNLANLFDIKISLRALTLYPVIQFGIFVVFFIIGALTFIILYKSIKYKRTE